MNKPPNHRLVVAAIAALGTVHDLYDALRGALDVLHWIA